MNLIPNFTLVIQLVTFLVLMVILDRILFKPMLRLFNERKARTEGRRAAAAKATEKAEGIWDDYQGELAKVKAESDSSRMEVIREAEAKRQQITDVAMAEADKTVAGIRAKVSAETDAARGVLKAEVEALAKVMAEKIIGRAV